MAEIENVEGDEDTLPALETANRETPTGLQWAAEISTQVREDLMGATGIEPMTSTVSSTSQPTLHKAFSDLLSQHPQNLARKR
jgi:hypothetical protein